MEDLGKLGINVYGSITTISSYDSNVNYSCNNTITMLILIIEMAIVDI